MCRGYVIGRNIGEKRKAVDIKTALYDPAEILDPEKLAPEDHPVWRTVRQKFSVGNFKHGPVNRLSGGGRFRHSAN